MSDFITIYNGDKAPLPEAVRKDIDAYRKKLASGSERRLQLLTQMRPMDRGAFEALTCEIGKLHTRIRRFDAFADLRDVHVVAYAVDDACMEGSRLTLRTIGLFRKACGENEPLVFAHELYHLARARIHGNPRNLAEHVIEEGLAVLFCFQDLNDSLSPPILGSKSGARAYYAQNIAPHLGDIRANLSKKTGEVEDILYGGNGYPPEMGYHFGAMHAWHWLKQNGKRAADVLDVPAIDILRPWIAGKDPFIKQQRTRVMSPPKSFRLTGKLRQG